MGFPPDFRNDNGGIAIGYGYNQAGNINRAVCAGTLSSSGEKLRMSPDPAIARLLQPGGQLAVNGLQGNAVSMLRPLNAPPLNSYFIDYDDRFDDPPTRGTMGDVVIWRVCGQAALPIVPVAAIVCPVGTVQCRWRLPVPAHLSRGHGIFQRLLYLSRLPGELCAHQRKVRAAADELQFRRDLQRGTLPGADVVRPGLFRSSGSASRNGLPTATNAQLPRPPDAPQREFDCGPGEVFTNDHCQPGPPVRQPPNMCRGGTYCACPDGSKPNADGTCQKSNSCGPHMVQAKDPVTVALRKANVSASPVITGLPLMARTRAYRHRSATSRPRAAARPVPVRTGTGRRAHACRRRSSATLPIRRLGCWTGVSGNSCCPSGQHLNKLTKRCDPDNKNPKITITKTGSLCTYEPDDRYVGGRAITCQFIVKVKNEGDAPASEVAVIETPTPPAVVNNWFYSPASLWTCTAAPGAPPSQVCRLNEPLAAGGEVQLGVYTRIDPNAPGPAYAENCAALGTNSAWARWNCDWKSYAAFAWEVPTDSFPRLQKVTVPTKCDDYEDPQQLLHVLSRRGL